jgi:hypothetical protein
MLRVGGPVCGRGVIFVGSDWTTPPTSLYGPLRSIPFYFQIKEALKKTCDSYSIFCVLKKVLEYTHTNMLCV